MSADISSGLFCVSLISQFHKVPVSLDALMRAFQTDHPELLQINVIRAAKSLGFKSKAVKTGVTHLDPKLLPAIGQDKEGQFFILARKDDEHVLIQRADSVRPEKLTHTALENLWSGEVIFITKRASLLSPTEAFGFRWFVPAFLKYKKYFTDILIGSFVIQLLALATPIFFQVVIDKVMVHKGMTTLDVLAVGFFGIIVFEVLLSGLRTYLMTHTTNRVDVELGSKLYKHMLSLPLSYFISRRVGDSVARVKELDSVREFLSGSSLTALLDAFFTIVFFAVMFYYAPMLAWIVLGSMPLYALIAWFITPKLRERLEEKFKRSAENHSFLVESISGVETVKANALEPQMRNQWDDKLASYVSTSFQAVNLQNWYSNLSQFVNKLVYLLIIYFGSIAVVNGDLTIGQFIAFNMLAQRVAQPVMRLVNLWQDFQQVKISVNRLGDILNTPTEPTHDANRAALPAIQGQVTFENITFRYRPDRPPVLENFSFEAQAGQVIGIVGRSGSGKSTLTKLLQRLYVAESGRVLVDDIDVGLVDPAWLRQQIGVVLQSNFLFNRTVRENIALADPSMSMDTIIEAAKLSGAHEFISEMTEGYDTIIEEQGASLSGGQKQRIAIARALVTQPKIMIFDEATSALDYESEDLIQRNMKAICQGRTVFIIAHRLSAVRDADTILVVDKGHIVEQGPHEQLLKQQGDYARLYAYQQQTRSLTPEEA